MGIKQDATPFTANTICNTVVNENITLEGDTVEKYCEYSTVEDVLYVPPFTWWWAETWRDIHDGAST